jgi:transposase
MPQQGRIVGIDVAKSKADACIRSLGLHTAQPSTPQGQADMVGWLEANAVTTAVMEASGGYERSWAQALRQAGIAVRIVDPKRVRHFAQSAGRLAKTDPIDAEMIAWFAETFAAAPIAAENPERDELDRLVTARAALVKIQIQLGNYREHAQPDVVRQAFAELAKNAAARRHRSRDRRPHRLGRDGAARRDRRQRPRPGRAKHRRNPRLDAGAGRHQPPRRRRPARDGALR